MVVVFPTVGNVIRKMIAVTAPTRENLVQKKLARIINLLALERGIAYRKTGCAMAMMIVSINKTSKIVHQFLARAPSSSVLIYGSVF